MSEIDEFREITYQLYKTAKRFIERVDGWHEKYPDEEFLFKEWQEGVDIFDGLNRGYAERYEKEKNK